MKILLDESLPKRLKKDFSGHSVKTVTEMGWQGKKNGELMALMTEKFDVFVTADRNLMYQINLRHALIPIVIIKASSNRYEDLKPLVPQILKKFHAQQLNKINHIS